jgi:hypothetical protein
MTQDLLIGLVAIIIGGGLLVAGLPNRRGESPRFLQSQAAPMLYPAAVMIFLAIGIVELVTWAATMGGWTALPSIGGN